MTGAIDAPLLGVAPRRATTGRIPVTILLSMVFLAAVIFFAILPSAFMSYGAGEQDAALGVSMPGADHVLGTDQLGRDVLARVVAGARLALIGPVLIALGAMLLGTVLGLLAGYFGGRADSVVMRWVDFMVALPGIIVAIVVAGIFGGGYWLGVVLLIFLMAPTDTRLVRAATLAQRNLPYVEAAETLGASKRSVLFNHLLPNVAPLIVSNSFLSISSALVGLASLSFLGLGSGPGSPDWGRMLSESVPLLFSNPWIGIAPAVLLVLTTVSVNLIGDWGYERLIARGQRR